MVEVVPVVPVLAIASYMDCPNRFFPMTTEKD